MDMRCSLVAVATSDYDVENNCVDVAIAHNFRQMSENQRAVDNIEFQELKMVPVARLQNVIHIFKTGQAGWLWFNDFDIQAYIENNDSKLPLESSRFHDYSDAVFVPAKIAKKDNEGYFIELDEPNDKVTIKGVGGDNRVEICDSGTKILDNVQITGTLKVDGDMTAKGNLSSDGDISAMGTVSGTTDVTTTTASLNGVNISATTHIHVETGSVTLTPTPTPTPGTPATQAMAEEVNCDSSATPGTMDDTNAMTDNPSDSSNGPDGPDLPDLPDLP